MCTISECLEWERNAKKRYNLIKYGLPYCGIKTYKNKIYTFIAKFLPVENKHTTFVLKE